LELLAYRTMARCTAGIYLARIRSYRLGGMRLPQSTIWSLFVRPVYFLTTGPKDLLCRRAPFTKSIACFILFPLCLGWEHASQRKLPISTLPRPARTAILGPLELPFATFNEARISADALLQKDKGRTTPILVMFRAGTYFSIDHSEFHFHGFRHLDTGHRL
jgi:hypothetical protein